MPDIFVSEPEKTKKSAPIISDSPKKIDPLMAEDDSHLFKRAHIFSSFSRYPHDMSFQNQEEDEQILLFIRKAFITNFPWIAITILLIAVPPILISLLPLFGNPIAFLPVGFRIILLISYYLLVTSYAYVSFITWFFNIALVTNINIVDVDFEGLVYKNVASTKLSLVQDVSYAQIGVLRNFFDYGDVLIQTAGTIDNFIFESAPQPGNIVDLIGDLLGRKKHV